MSVRKTFSLYPISPADRPFYPRRKSAFATFCTFFYLKTRNHFHDNEFGKKVLLVLKFLDLAFFLC